MTLSTTDNRESYDGTGAQTLFPFTKLFYANADLQVTLVDEDGVETLQVLDTDYTVTGAGDASGGDVTMIVAPAATETLVILRVVENSQESDYVNPGGMDLEVIEKDFDLSTMKAQQNTEELERAFRAPKGSPLTGTQLEIPDPAIEGNRSKYVFTKSNGTGLTLAEQPEATSSIVISAGDAGKPMVANATEDGIEAADDISEDLTFSGVTTFSEATNPIKTDKIAERTTDAGVTIDETLLKDGGATLSALNGEPDIATGGTATHKPMGVINSDIATYTKAGATGVLAAYTLPAGSLDLAGKMVRVTAWGTKSGTNGIFGIEVRTGTTPTARETITTASSSICDWYIQFTIVRAAQTAGSFISFFGLSMPSDQNIIPEIVSVSTDTDWDADQTLDFNVSNINASDTITQEGMIVEILN